MKKIVAFLMCFFVVFSTQAKIYGIFAGVSNYEGDDHDLKMSTDDVKRLAAFYKSKGAKAMAITGKHATSENILAKIKELGKYCKEDDQFVFFFSGHGWLNCVITYDEDKNLYYDTLIEELGKLKCSKVVVYIDACYSGSIYSVHNFSDSTQTINPALTKAGGNEKYIIFSASRNVETAKENSSIKAGVFTNSLLKGLNGYADYNRDNQITVIELFKYLHSNIFVQHPTLTVMKKNHDFVLLDLAPVSTENNKKEDGNEQYNP